jgi:rubrerythrin
LSAKRRDHVQKGEATLVLEISPAKVVQVIFLHREGPQAERELRAFIADMNDDEKAHLTALAWVGRGAFEPEDFAEAVETAFAEATTPTETYLVGMPHLSENLEAGLEAMGIDVSGEEEDLL